MSFMERIKSERCRFFDFLDQYDCSQLILWGGGLAVKTIIPYFEQRGLTDFVVCVSEEYWKPDQLMMDKYPIYNLSVVMEETEIKRDILVAHLNDHVDLTVELPKRFSNRINRVFQFDVFPHFWQGPVLSYVDRAFYETHDDELETIYNYLEDDMSKKCMISFIEQRISGDYSFSEGVLADPQNEYFEPEFIDVNERVTLIDCGAYDGRETEDFFRRYGEDSFSFVLEPDSENNEIIKKRLEKYNDRVSILNVALAEKEGTVTFVSGGGLGSGIGTNGDVKVPAISLDKLYLENKERFQNRVFIKMDIEGSEPSALRGGTLLLKEKKPILAICAYHLKEDLITIPQIIKSVNPEYKIFLRRYYRGFRDTVLYAV